MRHSFDALAQVTRELDADVRWLLVADMAVTAPSAADERYRTVFLPEQARALHPARVERPEPVQVAACLRRVPPVRRVLPAPPSNWSNCCGRRA